MSSPSPRRITRVWWAVIIVALVGVSLEGYLLGVYLMNLPVEFPLDDPFKDELIP